MSASFCPECGAKLLPDAKFCSKCGTTIENEPATVQTQVQTLGFCAKCGAPLLVGAVCCSKCGADVVQPAEPSRANVTPVRSAPQPNVQQPESPQSIQSQAANVRNVAAQLGRVTSAPATGGEFALDIPYANTLEGVGELMSPFKAVFSGVTRIISGVRT